MANAQMKRLEALQQMMLQEQGKVIVEFKAGICKQSGTTVTADSRRGTITIKESAGDGRTRIQWRTRPGNKLETNLVIQPGDCTVEKIPECKDGRVLLVRMASTSRKLFFWMQEPKPEGDEDIVKKLKTAFLSARGGGGGGMGIGGAGNVAAGSQGADQMQLLQQLLMRQAGAGAGAGAGAEAGAGARLASGSSPGVPNNLVANQMAIQQMQQMRAHSLTYVVNQGSLIMESLDEKSKQALYAFLPEGQQNEDGLKASLTSPQLQQGAKRLTSVLNSAQYGAIATSFGLQNTGEMGCKAFIDAIKRKFPGDRKEAEEKKQEEEDADANMEIE
ncbi:hypothetical protein AAMO2058_000584800 [Amorphochlora amoebiformis]